MVVKKKKSLHQNFYVYHHCTIVTYKPDKRTGTFFDLQGTYPFAILITFALFFIRRNINMISLTLLAH